MIFVINYNSCRSCKKQLYLNVTSLAYLNMEYNVNVILGQKLKFLRLKKNWNQQSVAKLIGLSSQQVYSKLENGETSFTDDVINKISKTFDMDPTEFVKPNESIHISNSPNANNNSPNGILNEAMLIKELLKAKNETIELLHILINEMKNTIELLQNEKQSK
jgi:transcriptional regulator with XRE-family HTH domain